MYASKLGPRQGDKEAVFPWFTCFIDGTSALSTRVLDRFIYPKGARVDIDGGGRRNPYLLPALVAGDELQYNRRQTHLRFHTACMCRLHGRLCTNN